jgi:hypothetical protein
MENNEIRITIDPNGNIQREVVEPIQPEVRKPGLLKRMTALLMPGKTALDNR